MDQKQHRNVPITLVSSLFLGLCLHSSLLLHVCLGEGDQLLRVVSSDVDDDRDGRVQAFIVHVEKPEHMVFASAEERADWHRSFLPSPTLDSGEPRLIYSYDKAMSGFAARLTAAEVEAMEGMDGFLHAHPAVRVQERTTRSQQFMGLDEYSSVGSSSLWDLTNQGEGMIIGVLDSGIDPTVPSFNDFKMPAKPDAWKHRPCRFKNSNYRCNNKVIGAVAFDWNSSSPAFADEDDMHGTAVASCAAGSPVAGASYHGLAAGTALGAAPRAYIAVYKAKDSADVLAAFDQAIRDRVDVFSVSQGYPYAAPFYDDTYAIGALSAVENGIFVSVAAGNTGPSAGTILDNVPWTLSVGASSIDRVVEAIIDLGDGTQVYGESLLSPQNASKFPTTPLSLAFPGASSKAQAVRECTDPTMGGVDVQDKIVLCVASYEGYNAPAVKKAVAAGAAAVVLMNPSTAPANAEFRIVGNTILLEFDAAKSGTTVHVSYDDSQTIRAYYYNAAGSGYVDPSATIRFTGTKLGASPNPRVTSFSSRGPSAVNGGILKPDILGPGHNILSALPSYSPFKPFVMVSGTSLACPHLSGVAALLKKSHPKWKPAAIRSAIMTTADVADNTGAFIKDDETGGRAKAFATGAGQVNPAKANDPGLVYDIDLNDYTRYVCGLYQSEWMVTTVLRRRVDCNAEGRISGEELNYPSFWVTLAGTASKQVSRTVTNVVDGQARYTAFVDIPGVLVTVWPQTLELRYLGDTRSFTVTFTPAAGRLPGTTQDGQLRWVSDLDHHVVRSPIVVTFK